MSLRETIRDNLVIIQFTFCLRQVFFKVALLYILEFQVCLLVSALKGQFKI
jgi:hypothetical protein